MLPLLSQEDAPWLLEQLADPRYPRAARWRVACSMRSQGRQARDILLKEDPTLDGDGAGPPPADQAREEAAEVPAPCEAPASGGDRRVRVIAPTPENLALSRQRVLDVLAGRLTKESHPRYFDGMALMYPVHLLDEDDAPWLLERILDTSHPAPARAMIASFMRYHGGLACDLLKREDPSLRGPCATRPLAESQLCSIEEALGAGAASFAEIVAHTRARLARDPWQDEEDPRRVETARAALGGRPVPGSIVEAARAQVEAALGGRLHSEPILVSEELRTAVSLLEGTDAAWLRAQIADRGHPRPRRKDLLQLLWPMGDLQLQGWALLSQEAPGDVPAQYARLAQGPAASGDLPRT